VSDLDPAAAITEAIEHHRSGRLVEARDA